MHCLRRAAVRALSSTSPSLSSGCRTLSTSIHPIRPTSFSPIASSRSSFLSLNLRRTYATEDEQKSQSTFESATQAITETAQKAKDAVSSAVSSGFNSVKPEYQGRRDSRDQRQPRDSRDSREPRDGGRRGDYASRAPADPSPSLYVGNLYFEVSEETLKKEFSRFGTVNSARIIIDGRGLSKGFGYIEFNDIASATEARQALDGQVLEGRRLAVQFAAKPAARERRAPNAQGYVNAPSKTLFIGNMSYEMSDKDLNDLFRDVKNVLDVRVAIDRRTGQPRGFAHADFLDVKSAEAAAIYLKSKEFYGRSLRVDFSAHVANPGGARTEGARTDGAREQNY